MILSPQSLDLSVKFIGVHNMNNKYYRYYDFSGIFVVVVNGFMHFTPPQKTSISYDESEWYYSTEDECVRNKHFVT